MIAVHGDPATALIAAQMGVDGVVPGEEQTFRIVTPPAATTILGINIVPVPRQSKV